MFLQKLLNYFLLLLSIFFVFSSCFFYAYASEQNDFKTHFKSLKRSETYLRNGPTRDQFIKWTYKKKNIPVEVIGIYDDFIEVRDFNGTQGWINKIMLSNRRTVITLEGTHKLYKKKDKSSQVVAHVERDVILIPEECDYFFCYVTHEKGEGWIEKENIFGVYEDEVF